MSRLEPAKLHVRFGERTAADGPLSPRRYTLTHSDQTGDLFLTIGTAVDRKQISGWYTRLMRDEVIGEWRSDEDGQSRERSFSSSRFGMPSTIRSSAR